MKKFLFTLFAAAVLYACDTPGAIPEVFTLDNQSGFLEYDEDSGAIPVSLKLLSSYNWTLNNNVPNYIHVNPKYTEGGGGVSFFKISLTRAFANAYAANKAAFPGDYVGSLFFLSSKGQLEYKVYYKDTRNAFIESHEAIKIPAKTFKMGSSDGSNPNGNPLTELNTSAKDPGRYSDEKQHWVTLTGFYMSKYEVTIAQYAAFMNTLTELTSLDIEQIGTFRYALAGYGEQIFSAKNTQWTPSWNSETERWEAPLGQDNHPMSYVTWYGAKAYADWVGGSLPSEAQWEYAASGGTSDRPFGIGLGYELNPTLANFDWKQSWRWDGVSNNATIENKGVGPNAAQKVGSYPYPNAFGLYDMHGNIFEWCLDEGLSANDVYEYPTAENIKDAPVNPVNFTSNINANHIMRGGSHQSQARYCRTAVRFASPAGNPLGNVGFRVVFPLKN